MRTKKAIILIAALLLFIAVGVGVFFATQPKNETKTHPQLNATVKLNIPNSNLELAKTTKTLDISVTIEGSSTIEKVEYLLDGKVTARSIEPPFKVTINLANLSRGEHKLQAIAYDAAGNSVKSNIFTFTIEDDSSVTPTNPESEAVVEESTAIPVARASSRVITAKSTTSGTGGDLNNGNNSGDNPSPEPGNEDTYRTTGGWYGSLPPQLETCSNNGWNNGPATPPSGAIVVPAGSNAGFNFQQNDKTFWFAPGIHTLAPGEFSQIKAGNNSTYIGAPGAILDGQNDNKYAFSETATNVRIAYLEIRNFGRGDNRDEGVINHNAGDDWTMEYLYAHHNDGAAVFLGSNNVVRYNCLKDNGQYGFSMYKDPIEGDSPIQDIVLDHNEIVGNNQDNWEAAIVGCGCTGGGKFWDVKGATVTNNYVHDNLSTGLWADTNDIDFLFDSNWIEHNSGEGIWYEVSYNATISRNTIKRTAWTSGQGNLGSPGPAIYISESGGDNRLQSSTSGSSNLQIKNNLLQDNFSGVSIYENSNRFCNSNGNTSKGYCTPFVSPVIIPVQNTTYPNPINSSHPCYTNVGSAPYTANCRWHSKNVKVFNNEFRFTSSNVPCAGTFCGAQALFATGANNIPWAPTAYNIGNIQNDVMFNNNNQFYNNTYVGDWKFAKGSGETINWNIWRTAPFNQDTGSTISGQTPVANALDANTATLEGTIGRWQNWFSTTVQRSALEAHTGSHSLKVDLTAGGSWGIELSNHPGFNVTSGSKRVSFWAKKTSGTVPEVKLRVRWLDLNGQVIDPPTPPADLVLSGLNSTWQQASVDLVAPDTTATVYLNFLGTGSNGDTFYIDDIVVGDT